MSCPALLPEWIRGFSGAGRFESPFWMRIADNDLRDPADLAAVIRELAVQAHALRNTPTPDPHEVRSLLNRLTEVETLLSDSQAVSLQRWLQNLRRDLRSCSARAKSALVSL